MRGVDGVEFMSRVTVAYHLVSQKMSREVLRVRYRTMDHMFCTVSVTLSGTSVAVFGLSYGHRVIHKRKY